MSSLCWQHGRLSLIMLFANESLHASNPPPPAFPLAWSVVTSLLKIELSPGASHAASVTFSSWATNPYSRTLKNDARGRSVGVLFFPRFGCKVLEASSNVDAKSSSQPSSRMERPSICDAQLLVVKPLQPNLEKKITLTVGRRVIFSSVWLQGTCSARQDMGCRLERRQI